MMTASIQIHLLYASIVWIAAWLLTSTSRGSATAKYWIWVAASLNFLLPFSLVPGRLWPERVSWFTARVPIPSISFSARTATALAIVWAAGAAAMMLRLLSRIPARAGANGAPSVIGILRPRIALPGGIERVLTASEIDAVLTHEMRHVRRRDNLIRLLYEVSRCAFWFHPLVWIAGTRLALFRELSCDESATRRNQAADLLSALTKLAACDDTAVLQASASSFISARVGSLTQTAPQRSQTIINALLLIVFAFVVLAAAIGPASQSAAAYLCDLTHGLVR